MSSVGYSEMTTDQLFELLPVVIRYDRGQYVGEYFPKISKGMKGSYIHYENHAGQALGMTYRRADTMREVIIKMLNWLDRFGYTSTIEEYKEYYGIQ